VARAAGARRGPSPDVAERRRPASPSSPRAVACAMRVGFLFCTSRFDPSALVSLCRSTHAHGCTHKPARATKESHVLHTPPKQRMIAQASSARAAPRGASVATSAVSRRQASLGVLAAGAAALLKGPRGAQAVSSLECDDCCAEIRVEGADPTGRRSPTAFQLGPSARAPGPATQSHGQEAYIGVGPPPRRRRRSLARSLAVVVASRKGKRRRRLTHSRSNRGPPRAPTHETSRPS